MKKCNQCSTLYHEVFVKRIYKNLPAVYRGGFCSNGCLILFNSEKKKVYISGGITGMPNLNREAFQAAEDKLREAGFNPVNPIKLFDTGEQISYEWSDFMKRDIPALMTCDYVVQLEGWAESRGARLEYQLAKNLDIKTYYLDELIYIINQAKQL